MKWISVPIFILFCMQQMVAQTCCTAGAPIISGIGINADTEYKFQLGFSFEQRLINRLVDDEQVIQNDPRKRSGLSGMWTLNYTKSQILSFGLLLPIVYQNRTTTSEDQSSFGVGDLTLVGQLRLWSQAFNSIYWVSSVKTPTGKISNTDDREIILSPDMQSGSGTFDFINQLSFQSRKIFNSPSDLELGLLYRHNTTNQNFGSVNGSTGRAFKFGNEFRAHLRINYEILLRSIFIVPDFEIQYRYANPNQEQGFDSSNSGGHWINGQFGLFFLPKERLSFRCYVQLPFYQNLDGLQITSNFVWGIEINYRFKSSKNQNSTGNGIF